MTFYEINALSAALFHLVLTLFVLSRDLRSEVNRAYLLWGGSLTVWNLATFFKFSAQTPQESLFWLKILHLGVVFLPVSVVLLAVLIARLPKPRFLSALWVIHLGLAASIFTPLYIKGFRPTEFGPVVVGGPAVKFYILLNMFSTLYTLRMLHMQQRILPPMHRTRLRAFMLGIAILFACGLHDLLLVLGVENYPGTHIPCYPLGNLAAIFFGAVVAYSVLQHQLLDIHLVLSRGAAQLVRIFFMCLLGYFALFFCQQIAPAGQAFSSFAFYSSIAVLFLTAYLTAIYFPRFFGTGDEFWERTLLRDHFEYHDKIQAFIQDIFSYSDLDTLLRDLRDLLVKTMGVSRYYIIQFDENHQQFAILQAHPSSEGGPLAELTAGSPIFELFKRGEAQYLSFQSTYAMPGETLLENHARQQLRHLEPELCFPLFASGEPFGFVLLGSKTSHEPYTSQDVHLVIRLVRHLELVMNQIRLKNKLVMVEQMELLGAMSRGLAHDLNNLVTPISTYLQMAKAGANQQEINEELLPEALRNLDMMRSYIKESLFLSRTHRLFVQAFELPRCIAHVLEMHRPALKRKGIAITVDAPPEIPVEMDQVLIQRLLGNLLSNAIDATTSPSTIRIRVQGLGRGINGIDWIRLQVVDQGCGISPENLKRVGTPYFTTKGRSEKNQGIGLGLAICRKIANLHGGHFSIASELDNGTVVQVDLPVRQPAPVKTTDAVTV